jgi:hypothetical protein
MCLSPHDQSHFLNVNMRKPIFWFHRNLRAVYKNQEKDLGKAPRHQPAGRS